MKIGTVLIAAIMAGVSLPALGQNTQYKDTWASLCARMGKVGYCPEFMGTPRDREFSQLRIEEMIQLS
jgi:hypothetical protein